MDNLDGYHILVDIAGARQTFQVNKCTVPDHFEHDIVNSVHTGKERKDFYEVRLLLSKSQRNEPLGSIIEKGSLLTFNCALNKGITNVV